MIVRELVTKLGFNLDKAKLQQADKAFRKFVDQGKSLVKAYAIVSAGATAAYGALVGIVKNSANAGDEALKSAQKVGLTVEAYQRLAYAGDLAGLSQEKLNGGLKFLSKSLVDASKGGKEATETFKRLGISPKKYLNDTQGLVVALADKYAAMPDGAQKIALSSEIMSKMGNEWIPLFNAGSAAMREAFREADKYNQVIGPESAKRSEAFNDNVRKITLMMSGFGNLIAQRLIPKLDDIAVRVLNWYDANKSLIDSKVKEWADKIYDALVRFYDISVSVIEKIKEVIDKLGGFENAAKLAAGAIVLVYAGKVLSGIFQVGQVIYYVVKGLKAVQIGAMLANAKILLIPTLIVAAVAAIVGGIYYVYTRWEEFKAAFMGAAEAVIKPWWESFKALFDFLYNGFVETATIAYELLNPMTFMDAVGKIQKGVVYQKSGEALDRLLAAEKKRQAAGDPIFGFAGEFGKRFAPTFNQDMSALKEDIKKMIDFGGPNMEAMTGPMPAQAFAPVPSAPLAPVASNKTVNMKANINVKLPDGAVKKEIEKGIIEAIQKIIRMTDPITGSGGG